MIWKWFSLNFQHCYHCGSMALQNGHFCQRCIDQQESKFRPSVTESRLDWRGFPLIVLGSYRERETRQLISALKGGDRKIDFTRLAKALVQRRMGQSIAPPHGPVSVIPCPSHQGSRPDHASCLALEICALTGWDFQNALQFQGIEGQSQKQKKATERHDRRFTLRVESRRPEGTLIFVDDLITTGSTVEAAWTALKRPLAFEVWCIAHQPKLAIKGPV